jgi:general secretion pathway protein E
VARLVDMGIEPYLVATSLSAVLAQRLVRVLCKNCKAPQSVTPEEARMFKTPPKALWRAPGCPKCFNTGYYGRTGIFEFLSVGPDTRQLILKSQDADTIRKHAVSKGLKTMLEDGVERRLPG